MSDNEYLQRINTSQKVKFSNEIKVGLTIIAATVVFILGVRYFEDLPLFDTTYNLVAEFDEAGGLIAGNIVRVSGVTVGSVNAVYISGESGRVVVEFHVDRSIPVTQGAYAQVAGFDALGVVRLDLFLADPDGVVIEEGGHVEGRGASDLLGELSARAPEMVDQVDRVLAGLETTLAETGTLLSEPESDLRMTLQSVQGSVETLEGILESERDRISQILENVDSLTANAAGALGEDGQRITDLTDNLNHSLTVIDESITQFSETGEKLNVLLDKLNNGDGTLGMLINDPSMYEKLDSTLTGINNLLADFQNDPAKYLKEMKLVDLF